jgi:hypothetical protein
MNNFERILVERREKTEFNETLWSELYQRHCSLADTSDSNLKKRLIEIEKNIQFLDGSKSWNEAYEAEYGWQSPWWWFRARQFTICEFERRGISSVPAIDIGARNSFHSDYARRRKPTAVRISKLEWLADLLDGKVRFGAASLYNDVALQDAQRDDEIFRNVFLPGSLATFTTETGERRSLIGEIRLSTSYTYTINGTTTALPYWLLCFSTELDPRLLEEFSVGNRQDHGFFVLFDIEKFHRRLSESIQTLKVSCGRVEVDYYDEHFPPPQQGPVIGRKPFRFAYQRELRFFLLPEGRSRPAFGQHVCFSAEKMNDIAGVYNSIGEKEAGYGPKRLFSTSYSKKFS